MQKEKGQQESGDSSPTEESGFNGWSDEPHQVKSVIEDWGDDTSEEAVKQRMLSLGEGIKGLTYNNDLDKSVQERFDIFFTYVKVCEAELVEIIIF